MDKTGIPTKKYTFGDKEIELYEWITQQEEDEYQAILFGDNEIKAQPGNKDAVNEIELTISLNRLAQGKTHLIKAYLASMTYEEYNVLNPEIRAEINKEVEKINGKKK